MRISTILLFLFLSVFLNAAAAAAHRSALQQGIAEEVVRFHVLANSDSEEDQTVKYLVRDVVLAWISGSLEALPEGKMPDRAEITQFLSENLSQAEKVANAVLKEQGMPYRAAAELTQCYFPDRTYGDYTFPAGWYEALRIRLGEANGQNWWCLLYPELCFSDCLHAVIGDSAMETLENILTVEEYETLLQSPASWKLSFRFGRR